jgi:hypothetical protein
MINITHLPSWREGRHHSDFQSELYDATDIIDSSLTNLDVFDDTLGPPYPAIRYPLNTLDTIGTTDDDLVTPGHIKDIQRIVRHLNGIF